MKRLIITTIIAFMLSVPAMAGEIEELKLRIELNKERQARLASQFEMLKIKRTVLEKQLKDLVDKEAKKPEKPKKKGSKKWKR